MTSTGRPARRVPASLRLGALDPRAVPVLRATQALAGSIPVAVVGGAVRDVCLGRRAPRAGFDVDLAVPSGALALARAVADRVRGAYLELDAERGAARVILAGGRLDIAEWRAATLEDDLRARDFTVNALAADLCALLRDGSAAILDPTGGRLDLAAGRLRPPDVRVLREDPLRTLRGVRLEATLGLKLTPAAARAIREIAPALTAASPERQRDELLALLGVARTGRALRRLDALGLLTVLFPEVEAMRATSQPEPHRFGVLEHSLRAVEGVDRLVATPAVVGTEAEEIAAHLGEELGGGLDRTHVLRLAALLHDVAKPETRAVVRGRVRFFDHDIRGAARAEAIGERLRLPSRAVATLARLVRHHLRPMHLAQTGEITRRARYRFFRDLAEDSRDLLLLALADAAAVTGISPAQAWRRSWVVRQLMAGWQEEQRAAATPPLLRGGDVIRHFHLEPGPVVGALLRQAREAQALGLVRSREEALAYLDSSQNDP
jgi:putative nucleotidyltransferase with HDIG domain